MWKFGVQNGLLGQRGMNVFGNEERGKCLLAHLIWAHISEDDMLLCARVDLC